jgi:hypothetical protein
MTREEAILKWIIPAIKNTWNEKKCNEIIKALEQEPCEDCISRKEAIKAMEDKAKGLKNIDTINGLCGAVAILYDLPSVQPIRPKGEWIEHPSVANPHKSCPFCDVHVNRKSNFCPTCGADLRGEE